MFNCKKGEKLKNQLTESAEKILVENLNKLNCDESSYQGKERQAAEMLYLIQEDYVEKLILQHYINKNKGMKCICHRCRYYTDMHSAFSENGIIKQLCERCYIKSLFRVQKVETSEYDGSIVNASKRLSL
jgi:hypothetical protein